MLKAIKQLWDAGEHGLACMVAFMVVMMPIAVIGAVGMTIALIRYLLLETP